MRILIITQKVDLNDPFLGFFHQWIEEFSKYYESVLIICLEKGKFQLPTNVKVISLGKEKGISRVKYIANFYKNIWQERKNYDLVFVHMNPIYVCLGGFFWRIMGKKIGLWYTHKNVDLKLRIAEFFANDIFTAAEESFNLKSKKVHIVGHGIELDKFKCDGIEKSRIFQIVHVGRITPIKSCETLIEASKLLKNKMSIPFKVVFVGSTANVGDDRYSNKLKEMVRSLNLEENVEFVGSVSNKDVKKYYCESNVSVNMTPTGGIDKSVVESMACGVPAIVSNKAFEKYLHPYEKELVFEYNDAKFLAEKIENLFDNAKRMEISNFVGKVVNESFDLKKLIRKIVSKLQ